LDPLDVTLRLKLPPDKTHRIGEPRLTRSKAGKVLEAEPYRVGMWLMSSEQWIQSPRVSTHIAWILNQLEPKGEEVRKILERGITADIFCFSEGRTEVPPSVPKTIRERANALGLVIEIDHYAIDYGKEG
jgi:hypothetical protein